MGGILGIIGILGFFPKNLAASYGVGSLMIVLNFGYNISVGPLCMFTQSAIDFKAYFRLHYCR